MLNHIAVMPILNNGKGFMTKIVLSSDYHLKFGAQFDHTLENGLPSRLNEIIESVDWVINTGKKHKATVFIGGGDIFDNSERLNTKEGLAISEMFKRVKSNYKNNYFIVGNHDIISSNHNILDLFNPLINVFSKPTYLDVNGARLYFLPYLRESLDVYAAIKEFQDKYDCPGKKYLIGHFWDAQTISVDPEAIDLSKVNTNFFDRIFLGHYHVPTSDLNSKVVYIGTLLNKRFNENGGKGCWILDTDTNKIEFVANPHSPEFIQTIDTSVLANLETLNKNAYYRVFTNPENVLEITKLLSVTKGFELLTKQETDSQQHISILNIEKKNSSSLKDYILNNCDLFLPEGITKDEFKEAGTTFMSNL